VMRLSEEKRQLIEEIIKIKTDAHFIKPNDVKAETERLEKLSTENLILIRDEILRVINAFAEGIMEHLMVIQAEMPKIEAEVRKALKKKASERQKIYTRG